MLLFEAASSAGEYQYYHLLSGQDLPLKTQDQIHAFFDKHVGEEFIRFQQPEFIYDDRVRFYYFFQDYIKHKSKGICGLTLSGLQKMSLVVQRILHIRRNDNIKFQKGTNWVSVTNDFVSSLVKHKDWVRDTFRFTLCADEIYKQTFAINYGFAERLHVKEFDNSQAAMVRLIDWTRGWPYVWRMEDKEELLNSEMMFARKFTAEPNSELVDFMKLHLKG